MEITASLNEKNDTVFTIDGRLMNAMAAGMYLQQDLGMSGSESDALLNEARQSSPEVMAVINARIARRAARRA